jgi:leader peptidase (prepilin peptidase)/N-methyltransferase
MLVSRGIDAALAGVLGLLVGSFLNVVIYRLPKIMERQWAAECAELSGQPVPEPEPFNLMRPRSRCRQCGHVLRWYENVPVLSYLALRGKCSNCSAPIGLRYPLVESVTGALFAWCVWHWGLIPGAGLTAMVFGPGAILAAVGL